MSSGWGTYDNDKEKWTKIAEDYEWCLTEFSSLYSNNNNNKIGSNYY